jgi:hypothetical protein
MKKHNQTIIAVALAALLLTGCGESKAAAEADNLIASIGTVTLNSISDIQAAEDAVNSLNDKARAKLENEQILIDARAAYDELARQEQEKEDAQQIANVEAAIDAIGEVTVDNEQIATARALYNKCGDDLKAKVQNYDVLEEAEAEYSSLRVAQVVDLIAAIGKVTADKEDAIDTANKAYKTLTADEKTLVTNYETLSEAQIKLIEVKAAAKEAEYNAALAKLNKTVDKVENITFYKSKNQPEYVNTRCYIYPYIGQHDSGKAYLRIVYDYTGNDWVFFDKVTINVDGVKYTREFDYFDVTRDTVVGGKLYENIDNAATDDDIEMLRAIAESSETIVRFSGSSYHSDFTVKSSDKEGIKNVLDAYDLMK